MARTVSPPRTSRRSPPVQRHSSSSTPTTTTATTNTTTTFARTQTAQRPAERPNVPIAPASSNTSSPIYSTTSSPPISPGISQCPGTSLGTMAPSRSDSRSTALAMELAPTSTPTGRISKAKKGKRVHACEYPGCGKIFTRAEHRRRHELNHNPDATYRCPQQGCGKSFHRMDLLERNQERHDLEASTQPSSPNIRRYPSQPAPLPEASTAIPTTSMASPPIPQPRPRNSASDMSILSMINGQQQAYHPMADSSTYGLNPYMHLFSSGDGWDALYVTDHSHPAQPRVFHHSNMSSNSSVASFDQSTGSPMIPSSMPQNSWTQAPPPSAVPAMFESDGMSPYASSATVNSQHPPLSNLDGHEWSDIRRELSVQGLLPSPSRNGVSESLRWHCWDLYWQCFHPTYPIVHRPSFLVGIKPTPLLACAMVAIGSYYDTTDDAKRYSLALLEIATNVLRRRSSTTNKNHKARIVDLQATLLLEILSTFCARQISVQMSAKFRTMFANLSQSTIAQPLAVFRANKEDRSPAKLADAQRFWIDNETRSRILHACSVLDAHQTMLFDQPPTIHKLRGGAANMKQINLPCDDDLWEASTVEEWAQIAEKHVYVPLIRGKPVSVPGQQAAYSYFQQQVVNSLSSGQLRCTPSKQDSSALADQTLARSEFDYHASWMCKHTPIRQLLMVMGESWLLGRKIERRADYEKAKKELRKWLDGFPKTNKLQSDCVVAHYHALQLLRIIYVEAPSRADASEIFTTTNMLHENWVIYLASLVCWVQGQRKAPSGVAAYDPQHTPSTQDLIEVASEAALTTNGATQAATTTATSCLNDPVLAATEAETYLVFTKAAQPTALQDLEPAMLTRTQGLLQSVRTQKIMKHMMGGLMNDAERVLHKLIKGKKSILLSFDEHT